MRLAACLAVLTIVTTGSLYGQKSADEEQDRQESRTVMRRAVTENCLICHSEELISSQRLTPKQWKAEVEKMVGWGSPLPKDLHETLTDFLSAEYPEKGATAKLDRLSLAQALQSVLPQADLAARPPGSTDRGAPLYASQCANCHGPDGQGAELGPNLVEKLVLARSNDYEKVVDQGVGRMPGFAALLNSEAKADILAWLRGRTYRPVTSK